MKGVKTLLIIGFCCTRLFANQVVYLWSGAVTATSAKVNVVLETPSEKVRLAVAIDKIFSQPVYSDYNVAKNESGNTVSLSIQGLQPNTLYYYCVEIDGTKDRDEKHIGSFRTVIEGPY